VACTQRPDETLQLQRPWPTCFTREKQSVAVEVKSSSTAQAQISDRQLRRMHTGKVDWLVWSPDERRGYLENLNEPPKLPIAGTKRKKKTKRASGRRRAGPGQHGERWSPVVI